MLKDDDFLVGVKKKSRNLFHFMWAETVPLLKHPHLKDTLTVCFIQFCIFNSSNGSWTFSPEITSRIAIWEAHSSRISSTLCQILDDTKIISSDNITLCVTQLETSAFQNVLILNSIYYFMDGCSRSISWHLSLIV